MYIFRELFFLCFLVKFFVDSYKIMIVPGMGGSVLYNANHKKIWPPDISLNLNEFNIHFDNNNEPIIPSNMNNIIKRSMGDIKDINIDTITTYAFTKTTYYSTMIKYLQKEKHELFAFPYDFRYILFESYQTILFHEFKSFVEKKEDKFIIICHSLGGLVLYHFLINYTTPEWYQKYISKIYFINVPFGGSPLSLYTIYDGLNKNMGDKRLTKNYKILDFLHKKIKSLYLFSCFYMSLPTTDEIFFVKDDIRYNPKNIKHLFQQNSVAFKIYKLFNDLSKRDIGIVLPINIIYCTGMNTTTFYDYDNKTTLYSDGDGIVPLDSMLLPQSWHPIPNFIHIVNMEHSKVLGYLPLLRMISKNKNNLIND